MEREVLDVSRGNLLGESSEQFREVQDEVVGRLEMSIQAFGVRVPSSFPSCFRTRTHVLEGARIMKNWNVVRLLLAK